MLIDIQAISKKTYGIIILHSSFYIQYSIRRSYFTANLTPAYPLIPATGPHAMDASKWV